MAQVGEIFFRPIMRSCPERCGPIEWTALETMKSIVIICLKSGADLPLRPPRIA